MSDDDLAPGDLELLEAFVNTYDIAPVGTEELDGPTALATWLRERDLLSPSESLGASDLERALGFREGLRALLVANHEGTDPAPDVLELLEREATRTPVTVSVTTGELRPLGDGLDRLVGRLLAAVHDAQHTGEWERMKACSAEDCRWAFYDASRNRSGRWCGEGCRNREKVRRFRARQREGA